MSNLAEATALKKRMFPPLAAIICQGVLRVGPMSASSIHAGTLTGLTLDQSGHITALYSRAKYMTDRQFAIWCPAVAFTLWVYV